MRAILVLLIAGSVARAAPVCRLSGQPWVETADHARTADARTGEALQVFVAAPGRLGGRSVVFGEAPGRTPFARCGVTPEIAWRRIVPRMQHETTPAPNGELKIYANAVVFGPHHGKWIGFDQIEYVEEETGRGGAAPLERGLGVHRIAATIVLGEDERATPGGEQAFRYTFRQGDGFLGWLTSFFGVPYLFGSAGKGAKNQAERYVGGDCADVLVAALRRAGRKIEYTSVAGLVDALEHVGAPFELARSTGLKVRPGDLLALDYIGDGGQLPRDWDHIVAYYEDRAPAGLGPEDLVIDSGDASGLKVAPLSEQGHVRVQVLHTN